MSPWQAARQIQYLLQTTTWPDSPYGPVFGSVVVTQGIGQEEAMGRVRFPAAFVALQDGEADPASPGLKVQRWQVTVVVANQGDTSGEASLVGGQRASTGSSGGRGLLEIEEALLTTLNIIGETSSLNIQLVASSAPEATFNDSYGYVAERRYLFVSVLTTTRTYPIPNGSNVLTAVPTINGGTTTMSLAWAAVEPRFDLRAASTTPALAARGTLLLTRKAGTTAPSTPSDGTALTLSSTTATTYTDSLATSGGSYSYGLFARFDEFGDGAVALRTSSPATVTVSV